MSYPFRSQVAQIPRPPNAWILYRSERLRSIAALNPGAPRLAQADISKQISGMWKNESDEVRAHYEHLAKIKKMEHQLLYPSYRFQPMTRTEKEQVRTYKIRICEPVLADKKQIREHVLADRERIREHARADRERIREQVRADYEPPDTVCNVCAEEFGPHNPPKSIPCGHILCGSCVVRVCERSSQRITPCCPFCRESFDSDVVRSVPVDYEAAEAKAPPTHWQASVQSHRDAAFRKVYEEFKTKEASRIRADVQRLEDKAVNIACKSSSVAELNSICNELQDWLSREYNKVPEGEHVSLLMSAALLRSILNERTKHTKGTESTKGAES